MHTPYSGLSSYGHASVKILMVADASEVVFCFKSDQVRCLNLRVVSFIAGHPKDWCGEDAESSKTGKK